MVGCGFFHTRQSCHVSVNLPRTPTICWSPIWWERNCHSTIWQTIQNMQWCREKRWSPRAAIVKDSGARTSLSCELRWGNEPSHSSIFHWWKVGEDQFVGRGGLRQVEPGSLESGGFPTTHGKAHMHQPAQVGISKMIGGPLGKTSLKKLGRRGWPKRRLWQMTSGSQLFRQLCLTASVSKMIAAADCKGQKN